MTGAESYDVEGREYLLTHRGIRNTPWGYFSHYEIGREDGSEIEGFDELQAVKTAVIGRNREAIEVFPDENRLVTSENHRHLWVLPVGERVPAGIEDGESE